MAEIKINMTKNQSKMAGVDINVVIIDQLIFLKDGQMCKDTKYSISLEALIYNFIKDLNDEEQLKIGYHLRSIGEEIIDNCI